jgi:hypothetical protein
VEGIDTRLGDRYACGMFRPTSPQRSMFAVEHGLDATKRARLERVLPAGVLDPESASHPAPAG